MKPAGRSACWKSRSAVATVLLLAVLTGPYLHIDNWRFLWHPDIADALKGASGSGAKFPSVWTAFGNSLFIAGAQMIVVVTRRNARRLLPVALRFPRPRRAT